MGKLDALKKIAAKKFNAKDHPRYPKGHPMGGQFMPKDSKEFKNATELAGQKGRALTTDELTEVVQQTNTSKQRKSRLKQAIVEKLQSVGKKPAKPKSAPKPEPARTPPPTQPTAKKSEPKSAPKPEPKTAKTPSLPPPPSKPLSSAKEFADYGRSMISAEMMQQVDSIRKASSQRDQIKAKLQESIKQAQTYRKAGKEIPPDLNASGLEHQKEYNQLNAKLQQQIAQLTPAMGTLRRSLIDQSLVSREDAKKFADSLEIDAAAGSVRSHESIRQAAAEYHLLTNGGGTAIKKITKTTDRAFARTNEQLVNLGASTGDDILFHEFAHFIEGESNRIGNASVNWIQGRATGDLAKMSELTGNPNYRETEVAYPDHYISPYVGKVYRNKKGGIIPFTEVISMGVERFASPESMAQLMIQDPEHFLFTLGVLRGRND